ncbi:GNAT family N-acetyltransferase [Thiohalorhabdus sp. Cl-TMA]|uniref:GNAT family N-acetyltransferase n=1 Tax=Thiohalorhabdus methylotrophus TaxID=3242694 RepID=A0ABV4TXK2_9GAMM
MTTTLKLRGSEKKGAPEPGRASGREGTKAQARGSVPFDSANLGVEVLTSRHELRAIGTEWNDLVEDSFLDTPFLRFEWLDAAWKWQHPNDKPLILLIKSNGHLLGGCPLVVRHRSTRKVRIRNLEFLTVPDTQECDIVTAPTEVRENVLIRIATWMVNEFKAWDRLVLRNLPSYSDTITRLTDLFHGHGYALEQNPDSPNYLVRTLGSWDEYYKGLGRKLKKNNNWVSNRLQKAGVVEVEWHTPSSGDFESLFEAIGVSANSWKGREGGSLDFPGPFAFIRQLSEHAWNAGWFSIWLLKLGDRTVAMEYQLIYQGKVYALRGDFDEQYSNLSPGHHLNYRILQGLFEEEELETYYMGPGRNGYKLRWTDEYEGQGNLTVYGRTLRSRLLRMYSRANGSRLAGLMSRGNGSAPAPGKGERS